MTASADAPFFFSSREFLHLNVYDVVCFSGGLNPSFFVNFITSGLMDVRRASACRWRRLLGCVTCGYQLRLDHVFGMFFVF